jgi:hypothetical protein
MQLAALGNSGHEALSRNEAKTRYASRSRFLPRRESALTSASWLTLTPDVRLPAVPAQRWDGHYYEL